jgi:hypothetical protein
VRWLCSFRGIGLVTALGLLAEIGVRDRLNPPQITIRHSRRAGAACALAAGNDAESPLCRD